MSDRSSLQEIEGGGQDSCCHVTTEGGNSAWLRQAKEWRSDGDGFLRVAARHACLTG